MDAVGSSRTAGYRHEIRVKQPSLHSKELYVHIWEVTGVCAK